MPSAAAGDPVNAVRASWRQAAHPVAISGSMLRARLPGAALGEHCVVQDGPSSDRIIGRGTVVAIDHGMASIGLLRDGTGLSHGSLVTPTGRAATVAASPALLGCVLDAEGEVVERLAAAQSGRIDVRALNAPAPDYRQRTAVHRRLDTGIRAIDGLMSCGEGQRIGIFASAGAGKTTLSEMLIDNADVDVCVIAMIGERGREVASMVERMRASAHAGRLVIVQATSDTAPAMRSQAALLATTIAEYFRDEGRRVLLVMDSVTRYARALRELALGAGEPPARRGYPASVFEALPRLVERSGACMTGSITAFYTVLLEDEVDSDPVGEEVKSLLDGHLQLSARLGGRGHYPALDVLRSGSRLFAQLADAEHARSAERVRMLLGTLEDLQLMRDLGEYRPGVSPHYDAAVNHEAALMAFLRQPRDEHSRWEQTLEALHGLGR